MKNLESVKQTNVIETEVSNSSLEFADVVVYNEMADQTSVKLNLISEIHSQLNRLDEMSHRRQFLMKEILSLVNS
jgi:hypothetical protein